MTIELYRTAHSIDRMKDMDYASIWANLPKMSAWWVRIKARPSYAHAFCPGARISSRYASHFKSPEELKVARGY